MTLDEFITSLEAELSLFPQDQILSLKRRISERKNEKGDINRFITCRIRGKEVKLTPEEAVRQLYIDTLIDCYGYDPARIAVEYPVTFGHEKKRADIVILDKHQPDTPYIIVELKKPRLKEGKDQLKSYCNATGAPIGVWTNGRQISYYNRKDPNYFEDICGIPDSSQRLADIIGEHWTLADLIEKDRLTNERKALKDLILEMEDEVMANSGYDVFEEVFKLIFTKLYDEYESGRKTDRFLQFRNYGDTDTELKQRLQKLFKDACKRWPGIFTDSDELQLAPSHLSVCVSSLQGAKLFNSNLEVIDEAFEYLMNKSQKGEKGQYFTPRYVIDMCVRMLDPQPEETMIDTAAGSCGFPVHTIFHVWRKIMARHSDRLPGALPVGQKPAECLRSEQRFRA